MSNIITIGNPQKDSDLITAILKYQRESKLNSSADAVRDLCKYALKVKKSK